VSSNKWTQQTPLSGASTRTVLAERAYFAPANTAYVDPVAKLNGADPGGAWVDMGIVKDSKITLTYTKEVKPVETGIEKVRRGSYVMAKKCVASWVLEQYDVDTLSMVSGLSITAVGSIGGKLNLGTDDLVEKALLFLGTNKVDGKEFQHYSKNSALTFSTTEDADSRMLKVDAEFYSFLASGESVEGYVTVFVLD
jgi:hypothetical protein